MLCNDFYIELIVSKTQSRTTNRKKESAILPVGASGFFRGSKKRHPLLRYGVLKPQKAKGSFRCNFYGEVLDGRLGSHCFRFLVSGFRL
jgi:hypothetical protein